MNPAPTYRYILAWIIHVIFVRVSGPIAAFGLLELFRSAPAHVIDKTLVGIILIDCGIFLLSWYVVYGFWFKSLNIKKVFPYLLYLVAPLWTFSNFIAVERLELIGVFSYADFTYNSFLIISLIAMSITIWTAGAIFKNNPQRWYDEGSQQPIKNDHFKPSHVTAGAPSSQNPAERFFKEREELSQKTNVSGVGYTARKITSDAPVIVPSSQEANLSTPQTSHYPNADLAIKYRPEIKEIIEENKTLLSFDIAKIHQKLEDNPQIPADELSVFVEKIKIGNEGPFKNQQYNKIYSELYELGPNYQEKFMQIHDALGDTFDPKLVLSEFQKEIELRQASIMTQKSQSAANKEDIISDITIIQSLPSKQYETKLDRITLDSVMYTRKSKSNNLIYKYYRAEELESSLNYSLYGNIMYNKYLIGFEKYKDFLIMKISDGNIYATNISIKNIKRASKRYHTIHNAKKAIDAGEIS